MAIFAVVSMSLILIAFAATKERVTSSPREKTNVREELGEIIKNWPWVVLLLTSALSNAFSTLGSCSTIFYFKYVQGYDSAPMIWRQDLPVKNRAIPDSPAAHLNNSQRAH